MNHGARSLAQFVRLENKQFKEPLLFNAESPYYKVEAWIDPENKYEEVDDPAEQTLNMRKIIPYFDLQFRNDKIWTRNVETNN